MHCLSRDQGAWNLREVQFAKGSTLSSWAVRQHFRN